MREVVPMPKKSVADAAKPEGRIRDAGAFELGPPVLLEGEDIAQYEGLLTRVTTAVGPADILEEFWVRDVVDLVWEALRLRRLKASLLVSSTAAGLREVLKPLVEFTELDPLIEAWYSRDESALTNVDTLLEQAGLTMDHVMARTLCAKLDDVERIDRMIANAEARRHVVLREIDRHRAAVAVRLRDEVEAIEEAEFVEVPEKGARRVRAV
jgi:ribosomal protein L12E/L44/L45/RPP1/RPP2